jgi:hypothetical protein
MGSENDKEIERRRDEAVRRALNTPPQPKAGKKVLTKADAEKQGGRPVKKDRPAG